MTFVTFERDQLTSAEAIRKAFLTAASNDDLAGMTPKFSGFSENVPQRVLVLMQATHSLFEVLDQAPGKRPGKKSQIVSKIHDAAKGDILAKPADEDSKGIINSGSSISRSQILNMRGTPASLTSAQLPGKTPILPTTCAATEVAKRTHSVSGVGERHKDGMLMKCMSDPARVTPDSSRRPSTKINKLVLQALGPKSTVQLPQEVPKAAAQQKTTRFQAQTTSEKGASKCDSSLPGSMNGSMNGSVNGSMLGCKAQSTSQKGAPQHDSAHGSMNGSLTGVIDYRAQSTSQKGAPQHDSAHGSMNGSLTGVIDYRAILTTGDQVITPVGDQAAFAPDAELVVEEDPPSEDDTEETEVIVGPTPMATQPFKLEELHIPHTSSSDGKNSILSCVPVIAFSEVMRLRCPRGPGEKPLPISFGSVLHICGHEDHCRPCMFERSAGRCRKGWLCDFCHMHTGRKRKVVAVPWQGPVSE